MRALTWPDCVNMPRRARAARLSASFGTRHRHEAVPENTRKHAEKRNFTPVLYFLPAVMHARKTSEGSQYAWQTYPYKTVLYRIPVKRPRLSKSVLGPRPLPSAR